MIISITGTPKTGKTSVAKALAKRLGWRLVSLNRLAREKNLYSGYDRARKSRIVDLKGLRQEILRISKEEKNLILDSHYSHDMPCDVVVILRTNPGELRRRMRRAGWGKKKTEENIEAEIMEVVKGEAIERMKASHENEGVCRHLPSNDTFGPKSAKRVIEIDTTGRRPEWVAGQIVKKLKEAG